MSVENVLKNIDNWTIDILRKLTFLGDHFTEWNQNEGLIYLASKAKPEMTIREFKKGRLEEKPEMGSYGFIENELADIYLAHSCGCDCSYGITSPIGVETLNYQKFGQVFLFVQTAKCGEPFDNALKRHWKMDDEGLQKWYAQEMEEKVISLRGIAAKELHEENRVLMNRLHIVPYKRR